MTPTVSVLLPVFNAEKYLKQCLLSLQTQTYNDFEVILVDDGSTDQSVEIAQSFEDPRIQIVSIEHAGISRALNIGLTHCRGEFIARMDADDIAFPYRIEKQVQHLSSNPEIDVSSCLVEHLSEEPDQGGYQYYINWINGLVSPEEHYRKRFVEAPLAHPSVMFRKELVTRYGGYSEDNIPEDFELWLRWMHRGVRFQKIPEVLLQWRDVKDRLSRSHDNYSDDAFHQVKSKYFSDWYEKQGKGRDVWIWGNSKWVRKRTKHLDDRSLDISGFIDVVHSKSPDVIHYNNIECLDDPIILSYVADRVGKKQIEDFLIGGGYKEGDQFFMMV